MWFAISIQHTFLVEGDGFGSEGEATLGFFSTEVIMTSSVHGLLLLVGVCVVTTELAGGRIITSVLAIVRAVGCFECTGTIVFGLVVLAMTVALVEGGGVLLIAMTVALVEGGGVLLIVAAAILGGVVGGGVLVTACALLPW